MQFYTTASPYIDPSILTRLAGRSYSGALKYRQLCRSVLIIHKLQWIQHHHYLLRADGEHQNHVEVERDFRDLEAAMDDLLANPAKAQRIAEYSVKTFRERYLTVAAEACYWRSLVRTWGEVTKGWEVRLYEEQTNGDRRSMGKKRGVRYETFMCVLRVLFSAFCSRNDRVRCANKYAGYTSGLSKWHTPRAQPR